MYVLRLAHIWVHACFFLTGSVGMSCKGLVLLFKSKFERITGRSLNIPLSLAVPTRFKCIFKIKHCQQFICCLKKSKFKLLAQLHYKSVTVKLYGFKPSTPYPPQKTKTKQVNKKMSEKKMWKHMEKSGKFGSNPQEIRQIRHFYPPK
jgi:hypothetical protein